MAWNVRPEIRSRTPKFFSFVVLGICFVSLTASTSVGIEYSADVKGSCTVAGHTVGGTAGWDTGNQEVTFCICPCVVTGVCSSDGCSGTSCNVTIDTARLVRNANCDGSGSAGVDRVICSGGSCSTPLTEPLALNLSERCFLAHGELEVYLDTSVGDFVVDLVPLKPPDEVCVIPAVSEWGLASLVLLTMIVGTVVIRGRPC